MDAYDDMSKTTGKAEVIKAPEDASSIDKLTHAVLDDLLYNVVHDLLMKTHRDEKVARAATAAIRVEKLASDTVDSTVSETKPDVRIENDSAIYEDGKVLLKGNPLKTIQDILCPRCRLPRLLHPTDGKGARKPDPSIIYCKKHPYIDKPGYDIYGQIWAQQGPGRGKKKRELEKKLESNNPDSPIGTPDKASNILSYPSATCFKCKRCILVTRLNNHMGSCIGNSGRNASRAAAQKISNGNGGSQNDNTPPSSQKGTPLPGSRASSPRKRDMDEFEDDDDSAPEVKPTKKQKSAALNKKVNIKQKAAGPKKDKVKGSSNLSMEQKVNDDDDNSLTVEVAPKKNKAKAHSPAKKLKLKSKPPLPSPRPKKTRDVDGESESSGTLSSPPHP